MDEREVEEFVGLCTSIVGAGGLTEEGAYQIGDWLNHHEAPVEEWPWNQLGEPLQAVWADCTADPVALSLLEEVLKGIQHEWTSSRAMATYSKSVAPTGAALPGLPTATRPLPRSAATARPQRRGWLLPTAAIALLLVAAGVFAVREMKSAHHPNPTTASSTPSVSRPAAAVAPNAQLSSRSASAQAPPKLPTPSTSGWTVTMKQNVRAKAGRREIIIPKGTKLKVVGRTTLELMVSYKGEDLTIPVSATNLSFR
jgi:hypothetical protein